MKQLSLCLFFIFLHFSSFAKEYYVDLSAHYLLVGSFDYYVEQVIDASAEKGCIGFAQVGLNNLTCPAYFSKGTEKELMAFFSRNIPKNADKKPLIVRVNKIYIHEETYLNKEIGTASISLTFFEKEANQYKELLTSCQVLQRTGLDITQSHDLNIANCLTLCFEILKTRIKENQIQPKAVSDSAIFVNSLINTDFPISKGAQGHYGIYYTYTDFLYNTPDTSTQFKVGYNQIDSIKGQSTRFKYLDPKNKKEIWGFWDGKNIYAKQADGRCYPLTFENGDYYIWMTPPPTKAERINAQNTIAFSYFAFGLIGAGIASIALNADEKNAEKVKFYLDYPTSEFLPRNIKTEYKAITRICNSMYNREGSDIEVWINGEKKATISVGIYFEWESGLEIKNAEIVLKTKESSQVLPLSIQLGQTKYVLCKVNKKGEITGKWLNETESEEIVYEIKEKLMKKVNP